MFALFDVLPRLSSALPVVSLGSWPSEVTPLARFVRGDAPRGLDDVWLKRDDCSAAVYAGHKVRTLETLFAEALRRGGAEVVATGAYGSNHALATALHARRVDLSPRAIVFPQPPSGVAAENLRVLADTAPLDALPHWSLLPFAMARAARRGAFVIPPGGATALGALGYVSAGVELAQQVAAKMLPAPSRVVLPVGSGCASAGLLVGFALASARGLWTRAPALDAVRVTPWPVTSRGRIIGLARRTLELLTRLLGARSLGVDPARLGAALSVHGEELGRGYGRPTASGRAAATLVQGPGAPRFDTTYSAKAAAFLLRGALRTARRADYDGPLVFWATKSAIPLPPADPAASERFGNFLEACDLDVGSRAVTGLGGDGSRR